MIVILNVYDETQEAASDVAPLSGPSQARPVCLDDGEDARLLTIAINNESLGPVSRHR